MPTLHGNTRWIDLSGPSHSGSGNASGRPVVSMGPTPGAPALLDAPPTSVGDPANPDAPAPAAASVSGAFARPPQPTTKITPHAQVSCFTKTSLRDLVARRRFV